RENWPQGIFVNGSVLMEGQKMSKSMNNIIPLINAIDKFNTDPLRLALMITAEPLKDADFSPELAKSMQGNLERFYADAIEIVGEEVEGEPTLTDIDKWMLSRLQFYISDANEAMTELKVRRTIHAALYDLNGDLGWYSKRVNSMRGQAERKNAVNYVLKRVVDAQVRILTPFTPHLCEEIWESMGCEGFVAFAPWPTPELEEVNPEAEEREQSVKNSLEDIQKIVKVTGINPSKISFYTATSWKWKIYLRALVLSKEGKLDIGTLIRDAFKDDEIKTRAKEVPGFARMVVKDVIKTPDAIVERRLTMGQVNEANLIEDATSFFKQEFGCEVTVANESDPWIEDPADRAKRAKPYRPAIYVM
ncbi:MAG: class I tRNA ligase family protein, partial [Candidatus Bathyarchaeota archaeon]|nr:class I tRNA ligase family protein [Candidatus Bathyarchaeota archaeon]